MKISIMKTYILSFLLLAQFASYAQRVQRIKETFDFDWKFRLEDQKEAVNNTFNDSNWETVQLPHDWSIKLNVDRTLQGSAGYLPGGIGWYRKKFTIPSAYKGRMVSIVFDGIFHQSDVYVNGKHLGFHPYGFTGIEYDMTPYLKFNGENVIAVRVDHSGPGARWYTGSGIYRHAWLQVVNPMHVVSNGTYVTTTAVTAAKADLKVITTLMNKSGKQQNITLTQRVVDKEGREVTKPIEKRLLISSKDSIDIPQSVSVLKPQRWSIDNPFLYYLETIVKVGNRQIDNYRTQFGIRTIRFDNEKGFFLNDQHVKLKGVCLHQDAGSLGTAVPDRSYERRLQILKEYGCNAIRCSHNPPSPEFLDLCDKLGFVVIDEAFDKWKAGSGYYSKYFDDWWQSDIGNMIIRDRNHPSVILWSIGNELSESRGGEENVKRATMLRDFVHQKEPTRPTVLALQNGGKQDFASVTDVIGYNYLEARMLTDHKLYPERKFVVTEELPYFTGSEADLRTYTPINPWNIISKNDFIAGGFIWPGVDYLGEAGWPSKGWPNGLFDDCMFEKPRAAYHRAMWNPKPMVALAFVDQSLDIDHGRDLWQWPNIASHWNLPKSYIGLVVQVQTITNCESVELIANGKSLGRHNTADYTNNTLVWYLPYQPGKLEAKAYNGDKEVATCQLVTSKDADHIVLQPDRTEIKADGQDLSHIAVTLVDKDGNPVQTDDKLLTVTLEGEGKFLGIDNGDLRRADSFAGNKLATYFGKALIIVQSNRKPGNMRVKVELAGAKAPFYANIRSVKSE